MHVTQLYIYLFMPGHKNASKPWKKGIKVVYLFSVYLYEVYLQYYSGTR